MPLTVAVCAGRSSVARRGRLKMAAGAWRGACVPWSASVRRNERNLSITCYDGNGKPPVTNFEPRYALRARSGSKRATLRVAAERHLQVEEKAARRQAEMEETKRWDEIMEQERLKQDSACRQGERTRAERAEHCQRSLKQQVELDVRT
eukprot:scaffold4518_cov410-Prasinococcus_capsulatus_cf.AAC.6